MATRVLVLLFAEAFVIVALAKSENIDLYYEIQQIHKTMKAQGLEISFLKDTVKKQQTEVERLNAIITNLQTVKKEINIGAIQTDQDNGSKHELQVQSLPPEDGGHSDKIEKENPRVSRLLKTDVPVQPSAVAFYAQLTTSETNVGKHHPIVFDHVTLNIGNGYNKHSGTFTAPKSGIYVFTFTLYPNRGSWMAVNIFKNSEVISQVYTEMGSGMFSATTPVAVIDMNVGDIAYVRTSSTYQPHGDVFSDVNVKSSFAGWQIAGVIPPNHVTSHPVVYENAFVIVAFAKSENIDLYSKIQQIHKTMNAQGIEMKAQGIVMEAQGIEISHLKDTVKNQQTEIERLNAIITILQTVNKEINVGAMQTDHDSNSYDNGSKPELHIQGLSIGDGGYPDEIEEEKPRDKSNIYVVTSRAF